MRNAAILTSVFCLLSACGYHVAGRGELLPKTIHTVAIPAFGNATIRYKLTDLLPEAITREFISRTRYRVVSDANQADMVLTGVVNNYSSFPTTFDPATGRASTVEVHATMQIKLTERATGKVLFSRPSLEFTERYEISQDARQYFEESNDALNRASVVAARQVVSAILNDF
jgi:outer membrane lipopolysaccharide assembly protein LptE/RlpB